jgi:hypothetical protein
MYLPFPMTRKASEFEHDAECIARLARSKTYRTIRTDIVISYSLPLCSSVRITPARGGRRMRRGTIRRDAE